MFLKDLLYSYLSWVYKTKPFSMLFNGAVVFEFSYKDVDQQGVKHIHIPKNVSSAQIRTSYFQTVVDNYWESLNLKKNKVVKFYDVKNEGNTITILFIVERAI